jgi:hypothetical protein
VGGTGIGVLDTDLRKACLEALRIPREQCRALAMSRSWATATDAFLSNILPQMLPDSTAA